MYVWEKSIAGIRFQRFRKRVSNRQRRRNEVAAVQGFYGVRQLLLRILAQAGGQIELPSSIVFCGVRDFEVVQHPEHEDKVIVRVVGE